MTEASSASLASGQAEPGSLLRRFAAEFAPRPSIYWSDLLISAGLGWTLFAASVRVPFGSPLHLLATLGAVLALLRAALFIHELTHLKPHQLPGFEVAWNLLVGLPLLVPSLMYVGPHLDHHRSTLFGTPGDPEYAPIAHWSRRRIAFSLVIVAMVPLALPIRWGLLGPLSRAVPTLRSLVVERLSTLVINPHYRRAAPRGTHVRRWAWQEGAAALVVWSVVGAVLVGLIPLAGVGRWLLVPSSILVVNHLRTLAAHGYANEGRPVDAEGQLLDSVTLRGWIVPTALVAPVGLRYHALHHHLPSLPYHSLGVVHRCLLAELPPDAPYLRTLRGGILSTLRDLWSRAAAPRPAPPLSGSRASTGP